MRPLIVLLFLALAAPASAQESTEHTLSVVGVGRADLRPDRGSFDAGVTLRAPRAQAARAKVNRRITAIVRGLRAAGVPRAQISTTAISINRIGRRRGKKGPVHISFRAQSSLNVGVDDLQLLARAMDIATDRGATELYGPELSFSAELGAKGKDAAESGALADARTRADAAAAQAGQRIVGVQSIDLDPTQEEDEFTELSSSADSGAGGGSSEAPSPLFAGRRRFTSKARVTYLIEAAS